MMHTAPVTATPIGELAAADSGHDIRLESCDEFERIIIRTRNSTYEVIVLSGDTGEVMVRGGEFFNTFRHAMLAGSIFGCTSVKLKMICVGCHLEFRVDGKSVITSRVTCVSRQPLTAAEGVAE